MFALIKHRLQQWDEGMITTEQLNIWLRFHVWSNCDNEVFAK